MQVSRRSFALLAASLAACAHNPPASNNIVGDWRGEWRKRDQSIAVLMRFERAGGAYEGSFSSEDLRVVGIPFSSVVVSGGDVRIELQGDASTTTFTGAVTGDVFEGAMLEGDEAGSFTLRRVLNPLPQPVVEPVTFSNGDVQLAGEIVVAGTSSASLPGIVFLHGSQAEGRWASRYLAHRFAERGFAALIFDKRGVGESSGDWQTADFDDLAGDGAAAVAELATHARVDARRIGVFGHSQGGFIAPLVAERIQAKFVIGSAAPGLSPAQTEIFSLSNAVGLTGLSGEERALADAYVHEVVAVGYEGHPYGPLAEMARRIADRPWYFELPAADDYYWNFARSIAAYDPAAVWSRVHAPTLLLYGSADERVPPSESAEAITRALQHAGAPVTVQTYAGADHTFRLPAAEGGWPRSAPGYIDDILTWASGVA